MCAGESVIEFTVYGTPQPGGSKRAFKTRTGRIVVTDANRKAAPWKDQVAQQAGLAMAGTDLLRGPVRMRLVFVIPRPKGHYGARGLKPSAPAYPTSRPDASKLCRAVEDALTGVVWKDDAQVVQQIVEKHYGEQARVEVFVRLLEPTLTAMKVTA